MSLIASYVPTTWIIEPPSQQHMANNLGLLEGHVTTIQYFVHKPLNNSVQSDPASNHLPDKEINRSRQKKKKTNANRVQDRRTPGSYY